MPRHPAAAQFDAQRIILLWLRGIVPTLTDDQAERAAAALIARFAINDPPLLIATPDEIRD